MARNMGSQFRKLERDLTKSMNKTVKNVNRKMARNPIRLPVETDLSKEGVSFQNIDNSVYIQGDVKQSQIGGSGHIQVNVYDADVVGVLEDIRKLSKILNDDERTHLIQVLDELQNTGNIEIESNKTFLENHPLISMGIGAVIEWGTSAGLEQLTHAIQRVFL